MLPEFETSVPDSLASVVYALGLPWEYLDPYAFPPVAILGKVVAKLKDYPCRRIIKRPARDAIWEKRLRQIRIFFSQ